MSSRIPTLLEPHLGLPEEASLIVLTSVLGATSNWLVLRYLYSYLRRETRLDEPEPDTGVVMVSFLRDGAFWRDEARRMGLDLDALRKARRFTFVDGLSRLFLPGEPSRPTGDIFLQSPSDLSQAVTAALDALSSPRKILIVDQPDALLAMMDTAMSSAAMETLLLGLREGAHAALFTFAADEPLVHTLETRLEREHAALVLGQVHAADLVLGCRPLDTGSAKDVSGVLRVTGGGEGDREVLYHVAADGGVRVFERGA